MELLFLLAVGYGIGHFINHPEDMKTLGTRAKAAYTAVTTKTDKSTPPEEEVK